MAGLHKKVGKVRKTDMALTIDEIHAVEKILEAEWKRSKSLQTQKRVAEMGVWFIVEFCVGLRGEDMVLIEFAGTKKSLKYLQDQKNPHSCLCISGRTKANHFRETPLEFLHL
jgi:hypothetical protein